MDPWESTEGASNTTGQRHQFSLSFRLKNDIRMPAWPLWRPPRGTTTTTTTTTTAGQRHQDQRQRCYQQPQQQQSGESKFRFSFVMVWVFWACHFSNFLPPPDPMYTRRARHQNQMQSQNCYSHCGVSQIYNVPFANTLNERLTRYSWSGGPEPHMG